jgi:hypothetical protein
MIIEPFNRELGGIDTRNALQQGKLHMVFVAVNALTFFNPFAVHTNMPGSLSSEKASELCDIVNSKNETGTLYPQLNISILPLTKYENRDDWNDEDIMRRNIEDAFKANALYIKSKEILFAFEERHDFNNRLAMKVLEEVANDYPGDGFLNRIFFIWG